MKAIGRNKLCLCGSGRKFKDCHIVQVENDKPFRFYQQIFQDDEGNIVKRMDFVFKVKGTELLPADIKKVKTYFLNIKTNMLVDKTKPIKKQIAAQVNKARIE